MDAGPGLEREVELGLAGRAILARRWLLVAGAAAGLAIGYLVSLGRGAAYEATAEVYLGQPFAPGSATPVTGAPTNLALAANLVSGEPALRAAAARAGLQPGQLRGHVFAKPIPSPSGTRLAAPAALLAISVTGSRAGKIAVAADALAELAVRQASSFPSARLKLLRSELAYDNQALRANTARLAAALAAESAMLADRHLTETDKLVALASFNAALGTARGQRLFLGQRRFAVRQELALAQEIESGRIVTRAQATQRRTPSRWAAALVGALIGLIVALLGALLWDRSARGKQQTPGDPRVQDEQDSVD